MARQLDKGRAASADKRRATEPEAEPAEAPAKRGKLKLIVIAAVVLLVVLGGGGGAYFFFLSGPPPSPGKEIAPLQPYFAEVKPFVVTLKAADGGMHYVQIALSLKVPNEDAIAAVNSVMPELQDMIRQSVLGFKIDELQTQDGVNKLRVAITGGSNQVLSRTLGERRIDKLGGTGGKLVGNVFFQNLVIE